MHPQKVMTAAEKLHQLIQALPENQINEILNFAKSLHQTQLSPPQSIPPGTLAGLRGIAKRPGAALSDRELQAEYTDYLTQKYHVQSSTNSMRSSPAIGKTSSVATSPSTPPQNF